MERYLMHSHNVFDVQTDAVSARVPDLELTPLGSSLHLGTMMTENLTLHSTMNMVTEKPYVEFTEVKLATLIDRISFPIIVTVGLFGNFLCFVTLVFTSLRTTSTCVYMAAIAVLDSIILVIVLCVLISRYLGDSKFYMYSDWTCGLHYFLFYFAIHFDVLVLLSMTIDRFIVVTFPFKAKSLCTPVSAIKAITGLGIFSFALNFQILFHRRLVPSVNVEDPFVCWYPAGDILFFMEKIYTIIDASIYSFIPFISLLILNLLIIRRLKQSNKFSKQFTDQRDITLSSNVNKTNLKTEEPQSTFSISGKKADSNRDVRSRSTKSSSGNTNISIMFLLVSFTFLVLTSPIVIVLLYGRHYWQPSTNADRAKFRLTLAFVDNIMYTNHAINFLLYCVSGRRFRQELKRFLTRFCY